MQNPLMAFGYIQKYMHTELHVKAFEYSEGVSGGLFCTEETYWYNVLYIVTCVNFFSLKRKLTASFSVCLVHPKKLFN